MSKNSILGGQVRSIPAYYKGQNTAGSPDHFLSRNEAQSLKARGKAVSINRGTAVLISLVGAPRPSVRERSAIGWKVVGQTKPWSGPGFPHWGNPKRKIRAS